MDQEQELPLFCYFMNCSLLPMLTAYSNVNCVLKNWDNCPHGAFIEIYVRKSLKKITFLRKKPGNKNFGKKSQFSEVLGQNVTGKKF